jgi:hypothetical protein
MAGLARACAAAVGVVAVLAAAAAAAPAAGPTGVFSGAAATREYQPLLMAAREALANRALALVDGAVPAHPATLAAGKVVHSPRSTAAEVRALGSLLSRRDQLRAAGEAYVARETDVSLVQARLVGDGLELTVVELTSLYYAKIRGDEPELTAYEAERVFSFVREDGGWTLTRQVLVPSVGPQPVTEPDDVSSNLPLTPFGGARRD